MNNNSDNLTWKFIINKFISWPIVILILFAFLYKPIKDKLTQANDIKFGSFQITVNEIGQSLGVGNIVADIKQLSYDELKLLLVIAGEDANFYIITMNNIPHEKLNKMYENLAANDLIELIDPTTIPGANKDQVKGSFGFKTTKKGEKVHRAILDAIYINLVERVKLNKSSN